MMRQTSTESAPVPHRLSKLFRPKSIAIVGASESNPWPALVFKSVNALGFPGDIHLVNKRGLPVFGRPTVTSCAQIGKPVDAAFVAVSAAALEEALEDMAAGGIKLGMVVTSGFAETGPEGAERQKALFGRAEKLGLTLLGPNSIGVINFTDRVSLSALPIEEPIIEGGAIGLISQSGATIGTLSVHAHQQRFGFSTIVAMGNEAMVDMPEVIEYLLDDPATKVIAIFAETIRNTTRFIAAARKALKVQKPIVMLKVGQGELAAQVAQAHTGALVGDNRIFNAVCRDFGIVRVDSLEQLLLTSSLLAYSGPLSPKGVAMASISGGACEIAADTGENAGVRFTKFAPETLKRLEQILPDFGTAHNPLDVTGAAMQKPDMFEQILTVASQDPDTGVLTCVFDLPKSEKKANPSSLAMLHHIGRGLSQAQIPSILIQQTFSHPNDYTTAFAAKIGIPFVMSGLEHAMRALGGARFWSDRLREVNEAPEVPPAIAPSNAHPVSEQETLDYLASHDVPVIPSTCVASRSDAIKAAEALRAPVALKILSPDIQHKTEIGGVILNVKDGPAAGDAFDEIMRRVRAAKPEARIEGVLVSPMRPAGTELIVGIARDPQWGLALAVGLGGVWVEIFQDTSLRLLPVTPRTVMKMLHELKASRLLKGYRGQPAADFEAIAATVSRIGNAALALGPSLMALEVNPLYVSGKTVECLDALVIWK